MSRRWLRPITIAPVAVVTLIAIACNASGGADRTGADATTDSREKNPVIGIPNELLFEEILVGGQPTEAHIRKAAEAGYRTVINLRMPSEPGIAGMEALANELGITYLVIPTAGASGMTRENAAALHAAIEKATDGHILVHCASGNRVGGLFALRSFHNLGRSPEQSLADGKKAGLTGLESTVAELLGL